MNNVEDKLNEWIREASLRFEDVGSIVAYVMKKAGGKSSPSVVEARARAYLEARQKKVPTAVQVPVEDAPEVLYALETRLQRIKELESALNDVLGILGIDYSDDTRQTLRQVPALQSTLNALEVLHNRQPPGLPQLTKPPQWVPWAEKADNGNTKNPV